MPLTVTKPKKTIEVVAAIIIENHKVLVAQRPDDKDFPLFWEFPGGKVESGETLEQATVRELEEELNIVAKVKPSLYSEQFNYPDKCVKIHFMPVDSYTGTLTKRVHNALKWVDEKEIKELTVPPADIEFINNHLSL